MNNEEFLKRISENDWTFQDITFDDIEVSQITINNCNFVGCCFIDHCFNNVKFINCRFDKCSFCDTRFRANTLESCYFVKCNFDMARMYGDYKKCVWFDCSITFADNSDSYFESNSFFDCQFEGGVIDNAIFSNCDLVNTWFNDLCQQNLCFDKTAIINVFIEGEKQLNNPSFNKKF